MQFILKMQKLDIFKNLLEFFPNIIVSITPKLLSSYKNTRYSTIFMQSNGIKSTKCQIAAKFRTIFFT